MTMFCSVCSEPAVRGPEQSLQHLRGGVLSLLAEGPRAGRGQGPVPGHRGGQVLARSYRPLPLPARERPGQAAKAGAGPSAGTGDHA